MWDTSLSRAFVFKTFGGTNKGTSNVAPDSMRCEVKTILYLTARAQYYVPR